jgi:N-acetylmuramoyl-L-alanine amidase
MAANVSIRDVRMSTGAEGTRVVLELSKPAPHTLFTLENPDRVVVDIPNATLAVAESSIPGAQGVVKQLRFGPPSNGKLRIVIDLANATVPHDYTVNPSDSYGDRLVIDLPFKASKTEAVARAEPEPKSPEPKSLELKSLEPRVVKSARVLDGQSRDVIVVIDAGHGGEDTGAIGRSGTYEKSVTLAIARRLKDLIDEEPGMRAILTRDTDVFIPLRERVARARRQQADMFVSIHADAYRDRTMTGSSVYVLSSRRASGEAARWLADRENAADLRGGVTLDDKDGVLASVLLDLSQGASMSASSDAADKVLHELDRVGNVHHASVQAASFAVLTSPDIPSMLVETAFISNPGEESKLSNPRHQQMLAEAIKGGVRSYFYEYPPPGTRIAAIRAERSQNVVADSSDKARRAAAVGLSH